MSDTPTPRTDARSHYYSTVDDGGTPYKRHVVDVDDARTLERELASLESNQCEAEPLAWRTYSTGGGEYRFNDRKLAHDAEPLYRKARA